MKLHIYPNMSNTVRDYDLIYIDCISRLNGKLFIGKCYVVFNNRYFIYPFVLRIHGHFCNVPCDLHYVLNFATCNLIDCSHNDYEDLEQYFGDLSDNDLIVADYNV